jgi:hypothetical protein
MCRLKLITAVQSRADAAADKRTESCAADRRNGLSAPVPNLVAGHATHHRTRGHADILLGWGIRIARGEQWQYKHSCGEVIAHHDSRLLSGNISFR